MGGSGADQGPAESWGGDFSVILTPQLQLQKRRQQMQDEESKAVGGGLGKCRGMGVRAAGYGHYV